MDRNTLLALVLSMLVFTLWSVWQAENAPPPSERVAQTSEKQEKIETPAGWPDELSPGDSRSPGDRVTPAAPAPGADPLEPPPAVVEVPAREKVIENDLFRVRLTNRGAAIESVVLLDPSYVDGTDDDAAAIELVKLQSPFTRVATTPFDELEIGDLRSAHFEIESESRHSIAYRLERDGVVVRKTFGFRPDGYAFRLTIDVENGSNRIVSPRFSVEWPAAVAEGSDFTSQSLIVLHEGDIERTPLQGIGQPGFFSFMSSGPADAPQVWPGEIDWAGIDNTYFISVLLPDRAREASAVFRPLVNGKVGVTTIAFEPVELRPGQSVSEGFRGFAGPKEVERLDALEADLGLAVNIGYQWISPLTRFFQWLLKVLYSVTGNYGVAIIIITVLVRVATLPIMARQMKSMEGMRSLQPKLQELQEKHKDDRQKQSEEMMKLYRQEGVNPLGGCLPLLLQFPVFIGLFYALQSSIDLRHAGFLWWITDLSAPESIFVLPGLDFEVRLLPILMGASMVIQQRMTPMTGMDPAQAKMMMTVMPIMMTVLFYQFPSGLVLYWMVSNVLGIAHQLWVRRNMQAAG